MTHNNHDMLQRVLDSMDALVYVVDMLSHEVIFINNYGLSIFGDIVGEKCHQKMHNREAPCTFCILPKLQDDIHTPSLHDKLEYRCPVNNRSYAGRDKIITWLDNKSAKLHIAFDITERKKAEEAIKKLEKEKALILDNANEIIAYHDRELCLVWANQAYLKSVEKITGVPQSIESIKGRKCHEVWGLANSCDNCPVLSAIEDGVSYTRELTPQNQRHWNPGQGSWRISGAPARDDAGNIIGAIEVAINISEAKEHEKIMALHSDALDIAPCSILVHDFSGKVLYANQMSYSMHGYTKEEFMSLTLRELDSAETAMLIECRMKELLEKGQMRFEADHLKKDRSILPLEVYIKLISWNNENAILSIATDITDRKKAETEIQARLREKDLLLKETHHRLKNNINSIAGLMNFHIMSVSNQEAVDVLKEALSRINAIGRLYQNMLISEKHQAMPVGPYLSNIADSVVDLFKKDQTIILKKELESFSLDSRVLFYLGILVNELLTNAVKYAFDSLSSGNVRISARKQKDTVIIEVEDNGTGITPVKYGFGLNLVEMITAQLNGSFNVKRSEGTLCMLKFSLK